MPAGKSLDIAGASRKAVTVAEDGFEDDAEGDGEAGKVEGEMVG